MSLELQTSCFEVLSTHIQYQGYQ